MRGRSDDTVSTLCTLTGTTLSTIRLSIPGCRSPAFTAGFESFTTPPVPTGCTGWSAVTSKTVPSSRVTLAHTTLPLSLRASMTAACFKWPPRRSKHRIRRPGVTSSRRLGIASPSSQTSASGGRQSPSMQARASPLTSPCRPSAASLAPLRSTSIAGALCTDAGMKRCRAGPPPREAWSPESRSTLPFEPSALMKLERSVIDLRRIPRLFSLANSSCTRCTFCWIASCFFSTRKICHLEHSIEVFAAKCTHAEEPMRTMPKKSCPISPWVSAADVALPRAWVTTQRGATTSDWLRGRTKRTM
mmetsp:Transcript_25035/g.66529  ORF Transcript_25035/g.66529 Transcript_25035/m.66529 type:complete len:303 (-) Transcript_25035:454-1362(-)